MASTIRKNAEGYGYKYTDLAEIHNYLESKGWSYYQYIDVIDGNDYVMTVKVDENGNESKPIRGCRVVQATLSGKSNPAQEQGSALTYARRYSLLLCYGLATVDTDAAELTRPVEVPLSKSELLDKIEALADAKGVPIEEMCAMAQVADLAELNNKRLEDALNWLTQQ